MRTERRRRFPPMLLPALPLAAALLAVLFVVVRAERTLDRAAGHVRAAGQIPFTLANFDPDSRRARNPGFEPVAAASSWTSGAQLGDTLFLAGPQGLAEFRAGQLTRQWRTGVELPRSPITALAVGRLRSSAEPELLVATAGDGALILSPGSYASPSPSGSPGLSGPQGARPAFQQLLPGAGAFRDLTALLATGTGDLLLGTRDAGLLVFSGDTLTAAPIHLPGLDAARLGVTALAASGTDVYVGTRDAGALFLHAGTALQLAPELLPDARVEAIALSSSHAYLGTPAGVAEFDPAAARVTRTLAPGLFAHTLAVRAGSLVIGTLDQGVHSVPLSPQPRLRMASLAAAAGLSAQPRVEQLVPTGSGLLALSAAAVLRSDGEASHADSQPIATPPAPSAALADPNISALALAPDGQLWVGLFDHGIDILDPDHHAPGHVRHLEDDRLFCIDRLAVDPVRHTVAAATANGLVLFSSAGEPRQTLTRRDGLIADHVNDIAFTPAGTVLATPAGITFLAPSGPESLYAFQGLVNNHVYTLAQSADGRQLLAGTLGGLSVLENGQVRRNLSATNSALRHNWITAAIPDGPSSWLIGTYGAGLERVTLSGAGEPAITAEELPAGAPHDLIINPNALLATPTAIYAGTLGHGLLVFSRASGRWSLVLDGLPSANVTAFAAGAGTLYIGTENGLVRIPEARLAGGLR